MRDDEHEDALMETGFWGRRGAGSIALARSTGRILLQLRSECVLEPFTWGVWGGAVDADEDSQTAALREFGEETGFDTALAETMLPLYEFRSGSFSYQNFVIVVADEFSPHEDSETADHAWVNIGDWPDPLHFGLAALVQDTYSMDILRDLTNVPASPTP